MNRWPIAVQIMLLVTLATLLASAAMVAITFGGPPPKPAPHRIEDLAQVLDGTELAAGAGRPLRRRIATSAPEPAGLDRSPGLEAALAARLATSPDSLAVFAEDAGPGRSAPASIFGEFVAARRLAPDRWLVIETAADPRIARWWVVTGLTVGAILGFILLVAGWLARRMARPIRTLAEAAQAASAGDPLDIATDRGSPEVRHAAAALADLHQRNLDHAKQRLTMLGAIAHDLGTPLTRLAFRAEKLPEDARRAAQDDIATMRRMIADSLTMARGWTDPFEPVDLAGMAHAIAGRERETGHDTLCMAHDAVILPGQRVPLQRMIQNLVDNALRYGGSAYIRIAREDGFAILTVSDDGPGFPETGREELLEPFIRGDVSRNPDLGGSGLGLAIAAQVAERHGGTIELGDGAKGGARVTVRLPLDGAGA